MCKSLIISILVLLLSGSQLVLAQKGVNVFYINNKLEIGISGNPVKSFKSAVQTESAGGNKIIINTKERFQTITGLGAAFSEIGSLALLSLPESIKNAVVNNLFEKENAAFAMCRLPIGASDFAVNAYSYAETPNDLSLKSFSLQRDEKSLIPATRLALSVNNQLQLFASPWSPPGWMKRSGKMEGGGTDNYLRDEDDIYKAYALYFDKYLQGYQAAGIKISRICPQNEVDMNPKYPGCLMEPDQMVKLVNNYLSPQLKNSKSDVQIWAGTFRENTKVPWGMMSLNNETFRKNISGLGIQYFKNDAVDTIKQKYPQIKLMFTEAKCYNGKNTAEQAQSRYGEITNVFNAGCDNYAYWNMILDENQKSGWDWAQNSLITINRTTKEVRYNPDYQPVYLVSKYVQPGLIRVQARSSAPEGSKASPVSAFINNKNQLTVLAQNLKNETTPFQLVVDGKSTTVNLPANADCVIVVDVK